MMIKALTFSAVRKTEVFLANDEMHSLHVTQKL